MKGITRFFHSIYGLYNELSAIKHLKQAEVDQLCQLNENIKGVRNSIFQLYGEVNRIRLFQSGTTAKQKAAIAKKIEKFDREKNKYIPFFDNEKAFKFYKATKFNILQSRKNGKPETNRR
jgi:hypothetical protein